MSSALDSADPLLELVMEIMSLDPEAIKLDVDDDKGTFSFSFQGEGNRVKMADVRRIAELAAGKGYRVRLDGDSKEMNVGINVSERI
jgi:hypothetical protein